MSFTESPTQLGLPSLHTPYWDPIMAACAETETVVNLHIGSSGTSPSTSDDAPPDVVGVLFFAYAMFAAVDWLYSKIPVRFPDLKICLSEGGIGWVAGLMDRLDHMLSYHEMYGTWTDDIEPVARRGAPAQLLLLRGRGPFVVLRSASASAPTTSSSSRTTPTATRRGRTRRRSSPATSPGCRPTTSRPSRGATRHACIATPSPPRSSATRTRSERRRERRHEP